MQVSVSADTQERWRRFYEKSANLNERDVAGDLIQKAESRAFWQTCFMIGSTVFLGGLMTVFYTVLSASH
jgi:hypothetical protein